MSAALFPVEGALIASAAAAWTASACLGLVEARKPAVAPAARITAGIAAFFHLGWIVVRALSTAHAPFSGIFESLVFFSFLVCLKALVLGWRRSGRLRAVLIAPGLAALMTAVFLAGSASGNGAISPALESPWILVHVPACFFAYVSIVAAFILALLDLRGKGPGSAAVKSEEKQALFFLGLGIVSGAFWADLSWGVFWSWDPKETWALVTWLLLALAFHARSKRGRALALGFAVAAMLFTYFGATFLLSGLHSYV